MFARVETFENPLHFQIRAFLEDLAQGKSQNAENITFEAELDFEKHFIFIFSMVENIKNPHHCRFWELPQGISQNVGWNSIQPESITFDRELGFRK
ncbi:hypothetical protein E2320_022442 [Naja naja]|nr:hypothetical protein E2320_022442 [Naja naja]